MQWPVADSDSEFSPPGGRGNPVGRPGGPSQGFTGKFRHDSGPGCGEWTHWQCRRLRCGPDDDRTPTGSARKRTKALRLWLGLTGRLQHCHGVAPPSFRLRIEVEKYGHRHCRRPRPGRQGLSRLAMQAACWVGPGPVACAGIWRNLETALEFYHDGETRVLCFGRLWGNLNRGWG